MSGTIAAAPECGAQDIGESIQKIAEGKWVKDHEKSDSMEPMFEAMNISFMLRQALRLVVGFDFSVSEGLVVIAVTSSIPWLKILESYPTSGESAENKRRDLRGDQHRGHLELMNGEDGIANCAVLILEWDEPYAGWERSEFRQLEDGSLQVTVKSQGTSEKWNTQLTRIDRYNRAQDSTLQIMSNKISGWFSTS